MPKGPDGRPTTETAHQMPKTPEARQPGKYESAGAEFREGASKWFSGVRSKIAEAAGRYYDKAKDVASLVGDSALGAGVLGAKETARWAREDATNWDKSTVVQGVNRGADAVIDAGMKAAEWAGPGGAGRDWEKSETIRAGKWAGEKGVEGAKAVGRGVKAGAEFAADVAVTGAKIGAAVVAAPFVGAYMAGKFVGGKAVEAGKAAAEWAGEGGAGRDWEKSETLRAGKWAGEKVGEGARAVRNEVVDKMNKIDQFAQQVAAEVNATVADVQAKYNAAKNVAGAVAAGVGGMYEQAYQAQSGARANAEAAAAANLEQQWWNHINEMRQKTPAERAQVYAGMNAQQKAQYDQTVMNYMHMWQQRAAEQARQQAAAAQAQRQRAQQQPRGGNATQHGYN